MVSHRAERREPISSTAGRGSRPSRAAPAPVPAVSTRINAAMLRHHLAVRGWTASDLAAHARLSEATCSHVITGRLVSERTLKKICIALSREDPLPGAEELVA